MFTIDKEKLYEVTKIYNRLTGDQATVARVEEVTTEYDWSNAREHQRWLDLASADEIACWLQDINFDMDDK